MMIFHDKLLKKISTGGSDVRSGLSRHGEFREEREHCQSELLQRLRSHGHSKVLLHKVT